MRGKSCSLDGLPDFPPPPSGFYVPGERHENLPAGGFARAPFATMGRAPFATMGTPVYSIWADTAPPEYATGGSGMFQGADFGHGKLIAMHGRRRGGYGQTASATSTSASTTSAASLLSAALNTATSVAQAVTPAQAAAAAVAPKPATTSFLSTKIAGIPMFAVLAALGAGVFIVGKKKKWF